MKTIRISDAIALVLAGLPLSAMAQSADSAQAGAQADELGEIVVTGLRASLRDALAVKRENVGVVEAISAKDIGVLPDVTIAETIARLPGVNTTRDRGNDSQAAIRGLGPRMVLGLINGREMASSEPDRNVRWEIFPSEIVSGVQVHKSSQADLVSGGISGTVDIQTIRPLDYEGPSFTLRAGPSYYDGGSELPYQDQMGYRASGAYVAKFTDDVGFVVAASVQNQQNGYENVMGGGWNNAAPGFVTPGGPEVQNPWGASIEEKAIDTTRASLSTSLQWRTGDVFEGRVDLLGSRVNISEHDMGGWYSDWGNWAGDGTGGRFTNNVIENGSLVATDMTFDSTYNSYAARYKQDMELVATGLNGKWSLDDWTLVADLAYSQAERYGIWQAVRYNAAVGTMSYDYTGDLPKVWAERDAYTAATQGLVTPANGQADVSHLRDTLTTANFDATRDIDAKFFDSVKFGVRYSERKKEDAEPFTAVSVTPLNFNPVDADLLKPWNYKEFTMPTMVYGDFNDLATALYGAAGLDALNYDYKKTPFVSEVEEKVTEAYLMVNYATQWGSLPIDGNYGVRAVFVDATSTGPSGGLNGGADVSVSNNYTKYLPSFSGRLELSEGQYLKFGVARALSRPPLNDLRVDQSISTNAPYSGGGGNPYLKPYIADQLDISYEKYFRTDGLFAVAGFYKKIHNYIGFDTRTITIDGVPGPVSFTSPYNQDDSGYLQGLEFTYQTPLFFIPHMENFGIYSNLALTDSDIHENSPEDNPFPMNGVAKQTATFDFYYAGSKLDARLGFKYHSPYTMLFTWSSSGLQAVKSETLLDFSTDYRFNDNVSLRFQAANLLDTPLRLYDNNNTSQIARNDVYGRRYLLDVTLKF